MLYGIGGVFGFEAVGCWGVFGLGFVVRRF